MSTLEIKVNRIMEKNILLRRLFRYNFIALKIAIITPVSTERSLVNFKMGLLRFRESETTFNSKHIKWH